jgi:hypothetical protein
MLAGEAVKELTVGAVPDAETVTVALAVTVLLLPVAVSVYVVVLAGVTLLCPEAATSPMPLSMLTELAFVVAQLKFALAPAAMVAGLMLSVAEGSEEVPETPEQPTAATKTQLSATERTLRREQWARIMLQIAPH